MPYLSGTFPGARTNMPSSIPSWRAKLPTRRSSSTEQELGDDLWCFKLPGVILSDVGCHREVCLSFPSALAYSRCWLNFQFLGRLPSWFWLCDPAILADLPNVHCLSSHFGGLNLLFSISPICCSLCKSPSL